MNSTKTFFLCCCASVLVCAGASAAAADGAALTACLDDDNAPFSSSVAGAEGIDAQAAQMIAHKLGKELRIVWVHVPVRGGFGKALKQSIQSGSCDFFAGIPVDSEMLAELAQRKLASSSPYLLLAYLLVSPPGSKPASLADARRARRIGAVSATPADLFLHKENMNRFPYGNNDDLLAALRKGALDMAMVWAPAIALAQTKQAGAAPVAAAWQPDDPTLRTGLAIATRGADAGLMREIDGAIRQLQAEGAFASLAARYGLPFIAAGQ